MTVDGLQLKSIGVHRMPGIRQGQGFEVPDLRPGINVVFGPNGCGKTTMAHAIQMILWPGAVGALKPGITGSFVLGADRWQAEIDAGLSTWRREGADSAPLDVGADDSRHRYLLALPDLVSSTGNDELFAAEVSRAMAGGFDLDAVAAAGDFGNHPRSAKTRRHAHEAALDGFHRATSAEKDLEQRTTVELPDRERELGLAREAEGMEIACRKAIVHLAAVAQVETLLNDRQVMPVDQLEACHRNDLDTLKGHDQQIDGFETSRSERLRECDEASEVIGDLDIGDAGVPAASLDRLADIADELGACERDIAGAETELSRNRGTRDECLQRLGGTLTQEQLDALTGSVIVTEAEPLARQSHELRARRDALEARRTLLPPRDSLPAADELKNVQDGHRYLADWMAEPDSGAGQPASRGRGWAIVGLAVLGAVMAFALGAVHPLLGLFGIVPLAMLAWLVLGGRVADRPGSQHAALRRRYEQLQLPAPAAWTADDVAARLRKLTTRLAMLEASVLQHREHDELDALERRLVKLEQEHDTQRDALQQSLGIVLPGDDAWLPLFASDLRQWRDANDAIAGEDARITLSRGRKTALADEAGALLDPYGFDRPDSGSGVGRAVDRLKDLDAAVRRRRRAAEVIEKRIDPELADIHAARSAFFADRGLSDGDEAGLRELLERLDGLDGLDKRLQEARGAVRQAAGELAGHEDLLTLPIEEVRSRRDEHEQTASRRDDLLKAITRIRSDIDRARTGHEVTDARRAVTAAGEELCEARDDQQHRAVGELLLARIRATVQETAAPEVFKRARRIFARITAGRFELLPPTDDGMFRAHDSVDDAEKTLRELSTGERVQLLLSVRLGFLEQQERYCLPLLMDETLGTSDDDRVREIMDALVEIARDGRQILYFTAQNDEAGKWRARLEREEEVGFTLINLGDIRSGSRARMTPLSIRPVEVSRIALPDGQNHEEYGLTLGAPGLDPFRVTVDQVHPWHVVEDCDQLHILLDRNIRTIGQFSTYRRYAPGPPPRIVERTEQRLEAASRALKRLFADWRLGRSRPIDMCDVLATGAVTTTFEPRVANLLVEVKNDPVQLLSGLDGGRIERWRSKYTQKIRDDFVEKGILSDAVRLTGPDLEMRLTASMSGEIEAGLFDREWIRRIIASLPDVGA